MFQEQQIKQGLHFQHKHIAYKSGNAAYLRRNHQSISLSCVFSVVDDASSFTAPSNSQSIEFIFDGSYLSTFSSSEQEFSLLQFPEYEQHELCCNTQMILHDLMNNKLQGSFRNMFIESKALALLLCFQKCSAVEPSACDSCKFLTRPVEKEKMYKAREILVSRMNNPPTIPELSREVGINQCYLKKGFKELFNHTVYDFVQEQRMMKAKLLLSSTSHSVSAIAELIGFSSASSFSTAFRRHTGILPSELSRN